VTAAPLVHFLEEQQRHRRTSAISAALVIAVLAVSGVPLSILVSPLVVAAAGMLVRLADLMLEIPPGLHQWLDQAFHLLPNMWSAIRRSDVDMPWSLLAGLFILPGLVAMVLIWVLVRFIFRRTGVGGVLRRMETRLPRSGDVAEQRVANLVQEVAVAAGVPPPRVLLIDSEAANVDAAGLRMDDATVVVTRGFIDHLPRDAQQALIAHVMGSVGNGDLTLAAEIMTLLQAWGFVTLVLEAPFLPPARASLRLVGRTAMQTLRGRADRSARELAVDTLLGGAGYEHDFDTEEFEVSGTNFHPLVAVFVYLPLLLTLAPTAIFAKTTIWLTVFIIGPLVAMLWRSRRWLADATAVQLTRYPEALSQALRTVAGLDMKVPGAVAVHFLFPVWDPAVDQDHGRTDVTSALMHLQLPFESRLRRLQRLGASAERPVGWKPPEEYSLRDVAGAGGWIGVGGLLLIVVLSLSVVGASAVLYVLGWLLNLLLVRLPHWVVGLWR
jgi:Zn-dependent protease with chaperone function